MIFFTRELYESQPNSAWEDKAIRQWRRRGRIYREYYKLIRPMLPASVRRLCENALHDGVVREASFRNEELSLGIDISRALTGFRGRYVELTFRGVKGRPSVRKLIGDWWLYEEVHLSSRARFNLQVLLAKSDLEIEADELTIKLRRK